MSDLPAQGALFAPKDIPHQPAPGLLRLLGGYERAGPQCVARLGAGHPGGMKTFSELDLARLIGAPLTRQTIDGRARRGAEDPTRRPHQVLNPAATRTATPAPGEGPAGSEGRFRVGARWRRRDDQLEVTIQVVQETKLTLQAGRAGRNSTIGTAWEFIGPLAAPAS